MARLSSAKALNSFIVRLSLFHEHNEPLISYWLASQDQLGLDVPPFVFGVTSAEGEIYLRAHGKGRVDKEGLEGELNSDTASWICSESKLITHVAALQLIERGDLALETPVSDYLPQLNNLVIVNEGAKEWRPATRVMTVEHLLHHTSGLFYSSDPSDGVPDWDQDLHNPYTAPQDAQDSVGNFLSLIKVHLPGIPVKFEPGTDWAYGWSSDILGFVIEKVSGMSLEAYLQKFIFQPLQMRRTTFLPTEQIKENMICISFRKTMGDGTMEVVPWGHRYYETDPDKVHLFCGGGHLISSTNDYLAFLRHLLQIYAGSAQQPIVSRNHIMELFESSLDPTSQRTMEEFMRYVMPVDGVQWSRGQAVTLNDWPGMRREGSGFWAGFLNTYYWIDPKAGIAAVFQSQYFPPLDSRFLTLRETLEKTLYSGLEGGAK
ncbi:beta-lactamase/transpeptidase-like protein [Ephemerocybe angulata]|uniref:Beta-lactamase/transpeptidase-like protein n=1 Tax=Ephemerocybe angulata TaxID=980116 RepID=A0A8H6HYD8_9AGAR|nr:beta-lactamase/transpeptidase-like protein [Tulosesus angulatus]